LRYYDTYKEGEGFLELGHLLLGQGVGLLATLVSQVLPPVGAAAPLNRGVLVAQEKRAAGSSGPTMAVG